MTATIPAQLSGRKFEGFDFSGQDLKGADLSGSLFIACNFDNADLSLANCSRSDFRQSSFRRTICYRTNFAESVLPCTDFDPKDCYGMTVTLQCKTFENMRVGQMWWYLWLMMGTAMRPEDKPLKEDLREMLISFIGQQRYLNLRKMLEQRSY